MSYRLVVFDWDGTLTDSVELIVARVRAAIGHARLPQRTAAEIRDIIGLGPSAGIAALFPREPARARAALLAVQSEPDVRTLVERPAPLFAGVPDMIARLADAGMLLAVATGSSRAGLLRDMAAAGIADRFAAVRTADDGPGKPAPHMLEALLDETGTRPGEAVVVGDTVYDLQMAGAAGVDAIAVSWGVHDRQRLAAARPLLIADRIEELPTALARERTQLPDGD